MLKTAELGKVVFTSLPFPYSFFSFVVGSCLLKFFSDSLKICFCVNHRGVYRGMSQEVAYERYRSSFAVHGRGYAVSKLMGVYVLWKIGMCFTNFPAASIKHSPYCGGIDCMSLASTFRIEQE